jgi:UDP-N-acetylglucosamine 2-epimerase (non-hydrolysing)
VATREQGDKGQTYMVGNILMDTLRFNYDRLRKPSLDIEADQYLVFTLNRKALLADEAHLKEVLEAMLAAADGFPIIAPLRGEARDVVNRLAPQARTVDPLSYLEFGWLTAHARGIITDSGNVVEEATFNSVPCITLNSYTEHQETVTVGSNELVGGDVRLLSEALQRMLRGEWKKCALPDRWDGRTAERIAQILLA